jgi:hypothetical protein
MRMGGHGSHLVISSLRYAAFSFLWEPSVSFLATWTVTLIFLDFPFDRCAELCLSMRIGDDGS